MLFVAPGRVGPPPVPLPSSLATPSRRTLNRIGHWGGLRLQRLLLGVRPPRAARRKAPFRGGPHGPADEAESIATIHAALDAGFTLLDTGDYYAAGHNELLIREALTGRNRDHVVISVKFGLLRASDGAIVGVDGRPAAVKSSLA